MILETIALVGALLYVLYAVVAGAYELMDEKHRKEGHR